MRHFRSVLFAHRAADFAGLDAGPELRARQLKIRAGEARNDACRGKADVGTIVAIADALNHLRQIFLPETGIRAGVARFRA